MSTALRSLLIDVVGGIAAMIVAAWAFVRLFDVRVPHRPSNSGDAGAGGDMSAGQSPHLSGSSGDGGHASGGSDGGGGGDSGH